MKTLRIYTDGSHLKHTTGRLGVGGVLVDEDNKVLAEFGNEVLLDYLQMTYGTTDVSNPTCEMLAMYWALVTFKKILKNKNVKVICKADYQGVQSWLCDLGVNSGKIKPWKINKPYIQKIKDDIKKEIDEMDLSDRIDFAWVKGHQRAIIPFSDAYWNDYVDGLAKGVKI